MGKGKVEGSYVGRRGYRGVLAHTMSLLPSKRGRAGGGGWWLVVELG